MFLFPPPPHVLPLRTGFLVWTRQIRFRDRVAKALPRIPRFQTSFYLPLQKPTEQEIDFRSHSVTRMLWEEEVEEEEREQGIPFDFDFLSLISAPKDYYKILEVDYDATDETIRSNYIRLALKWHPDKRKAEESATTRFQEINEAYQVLSDPVKREEYDRNAIPQFQDYNMMEYLHRFKGLILTCNGLGIRHSIW